MPVSLTESSNQYQKYIDDSFSGKRDKTAQFWRTYYKIIDYFLLIHRSTETNDIGLFEYGLFGISFFEVNEISQIIYSGWHIKPEVIEYLKNGAFSINCTGKLF